MSHVHINRITPSKYGDGDRWRLEIDGEWYDAYLTAEAGSLTAGDYDVEFKTSPKTGKVYAVAIDGKYRTQGGGARPQQPAQAIPGSAPRQALATHSAPPAPAESKAGAKDMWIMATSIMQAMIAHADIDRSDVVALARDAANAARAAQRVFDGAPMDAVKAAVRPPHPQPAPVDPGDPRETGPDFDDDVPF